ncbi:MAG: hypothetical protein O2782_20215 [bacterium]|nr:hypothetical protein [bacterium]
MIDVADSSIAGAERLLAAAPRGKESAQEIELIQGDLTQLRTRLDPARQLLGQERFKEAQEAASKIRMDADRLSVESAGCYRSRRGAEGQERSATLG